MKSKDGDRGASDFRRCDDMFFFPLYSWESHTRLETAPSRPRLVNWRQRTRGCPEVSTNTQVCASKIDRIENQNAFQYDAYGGGLCLPDRDPPPDTDPLERQTPVKT